MMRKILGLVSVLALVSASAMAVPYASLIRLDGTTVASSEGTTITYVLNESADSVTINVKNSSAVTVATFPGGTTQGLNAVAWDATNNNSGGTPVAFGSGYHVEITTDKNDPTTYTMYASNTSGGGGNGQVFAGFSPNAVAIPTDQTGDLFGLLLAASSYNTVGHVAAAIPLRSDLKTADGIDGFASRKQKYPGNGTTDGDGIVTENGSIWGMVMDPENLDSVWACGQDGVAPQWMYGANASGSLDEYLANADNPTTPIGLLFPRDIQVVSEGGQKYVYFARSNGIVGKVQVSGGVFQQPTYISNILAMSGTQYSKDLSFDAAGNMYWTAKSGAPAPRVYRWDASQVQAATAGSLTEANAKWTVNFPGGTTGALGTAVAGDGSVYALSYVGTTGTIYLLGDDSTATQTRTLGAVDAVVTGIASLSTTYSNLAADPFGNFFVFSRTAEYIRAYSPGGGIFSNTVVAPDSQDFDIIFLPNQDFEVVAAGYASGDGAVTPNVSNTDLIAGVTGTLLTGGFHPATPGTDPTRLASLTDGTWASDGLTVIAQDNQSPSPSLVVEYDLSAVGTLEADITSIVLFAGHNDAVGARGFINCLVEIDTGSGYTTLDRLRTGPYGTVPVATPSSQVTWTDPGSLAVNVRKIKLTFEDVSHNSGTQYFQAQNDNGPPSNNFPTQGTILKEIDVFGTTSPIAAVQDWMLF